MYKYTIYNIYLYVGTYIQMYIAVQGIESYIHTYLDVSLTKTKLNL